MSERGMVFDPAEGRTKQSMRDECDINNIVERFERTGLVSHMAKTPGVYLDVSSVGDYRTALDRVNAADVFFMSLPAHVRKEFHNDPAEFLDFASDPSNKERMVELGLVEESAVVADGAPPGAGGSGGGKEPAAGVVEE